MQRDKKLGLGLGILLVGVVAAFFFRHEPRAESPELNDPETLDRQIAERDVTPYPEPARSTAVAPPAEGPDGAAWDLPDFLQGEGDDPSSAPSPDPIPVGTEAPEVETRIAPAHNRDWQPAGDAARSGALDEEREGGRAGQTRATEASGAERRSAAGEVVLHRVAQGDTLSDLAARYLGSRGRFLEIYEANRDVLRSPNDLRVGITLRIPAQREAAPAVPARAQTVRVTDVQSRGTEGRVEGEIPVAPAIQEQTRPEPEMTAGNPAGTRLRFQPVRRSPLLPGGLRTMLDHQDPPTPPGGRVLTQKPPVDLLPLEDVFDEESDQAGSP